jgi:uncharacterized protein (TIGR00255 family)
MTGYGRAEGQTEHWSLVVELKSVNHRYLDVRMRLPRPLSSLETFILNYLKNELARGRVEVNVTLTGELENSGKPSLNLPLAQRYREVADEAAQGLGLSDPVGLDFILRMPEVIQVIDEALDPDRIWEEVRPVFDKAVAALGEMRDREGKSLHEDFRKTLEFIGGLRGRLEPLKGVVVEEYRERLQNRLNNLLNGNGGLDEGRLHQEVALFADRCDISEELARLDSHLGQFGDMLGDAEPVGRKLDFLLQEMFREINTMGTKANHLEIKQITLEMKNCVEKLREQAQNVE